MFSSKNKSKRPKFLLYLRINELINIPQSSGYCSIKWSLKDGTGTSGHHTLSNSGNNVNNMATNPTETIANFSSSNHGQIPRADVIHHKAQWNYGLDKPVQVKLQVDKNGNLSQKTLRLEIIIEFIDPTSTTTTSSTSNNNSAHSPITPNNTNHSTNSTPIKNRSTTVAKSNNSASTVPSIKHSSTTTSASMKKRNHSSNEIGLHPRPNPLPHKTTTVNSNNINQKIIGKLSLGYVELNISDYVRENEQIITNRFLLKNSKVNSILNLSLKMELNRGSYSDFNIPTTFTSGQLPGSFHAGIGDILEESIITSPTSNGKKLRNSSKLLGSSNAFQNGGTGSVNSGSVTTGPTTISASLSPVVDSLYQKTFKLPWDPRPGEFTPRECVEDILRGGNGWAKNEKGINLIDLQALSLKEEEAEYYNSNHYSWNVYHDYNKSNTHNDKNKKKNNNNMSRNITNNLKRIETFKSMNKREFIERKNNLKNENYLSKIRSPEDQLFSNEYNIRDTKSWQVAKTDV